jgi:hypothetical protein
LELSGVLECVRVAAWREEDPRQRALTRKCAKPDDLAWRSTGREREARRAPDLQRSVVVASSLTMVEYNGVFNRYPSSHQPWRVEDGIYL